MTSTWAQSDSKGPVALGGMPEAAAPKALEPNRESNHPWLRLQRPLPLAWPRSRLAVP